MILHESELHAALILVAQFATASTACLHPTHQNRHHHRTPCYLVHVVGWNDPQTRDKDEQDIRVITYWTYVFSSSGFPLLWGRCRLETGIMSTNISILAKI